jgi:Ca2+-binding EF-hand superfamily protein
MAMPGETNDPVDILHLQMTAAFNAIDTEQKGVIDGESLAAYFAKKNITELSSGKNSTSPEEEADDYEKALWYIQRTAGIPLEERGGSIDVKIFEAYLRASDFFQRNAQAIGHALSYFDNDADGKVSPHDILAALKKMGDPLEIIDVKDEWKEATGDILDWEKDKDTVYIEPDEEKKFMFGDLPDQVAEDLRRTEDGIIWTPKASQ